MTVTPQPKEATLMANKDAVKKYQQSRDAFKIRPTKEEGEAIRAAAAASGTSNTFSAGLLIISPKTTFVLSVSRLSISALVRPPAKTV